ncbi:MAG: hypothetical protein WKG07_29345 [Hymenobacter sp.]
MRPWVLFGIQFMWQFPHFWAIAWVADDDYKRAGFKMLPSPRQPRPAHGLPDNDLHCCCSSRSACCRWSSTFAGRISALSGRGVRVCCSCCSPLQLMRTQSRKGRAAHHVRLFLYLPIVQIALVLDKISRFLLLATV